ncbi:bacillithiol system redox-active protein YtxJ [Paenibacillus methanolicus]|uniref:Bacillithiol system protein YtxJ n=1 Tax=Paenibacillus methanolicus TaxID=582686 RepID=A0A5S5CIK1_9BACL|nr:bacillithiol system redox-active protein YtxJ [Paenibacillus methanolicus]TYP79580.1 bacillithiol system protein YtxJ [Paenibacillus methanolicus]
MWKEITTLEEWNDMLAQSEAKQQLILKHSTRCPVSSSALEEYEDYLKSNPNANTEYYLVKVIESRPVSNQIAEDLKVTHASPQIILFKDKKNVWNSSHWSVTKKHIAAVLD